MTITAVNRWKGGEQDAMTDATRKARPIVAKYGAECQLGRINTGTAVGDWLFILRCADWPGYATCVAGLEADAEWQALVAQVRGMSQLIERNIVVGIDP